MRRYEARRSKNRGRSSATESGARSNGKKAPVEAEFPLLRDKRAGSVLMKAFARPEIRATRLRDIAIDR